MNGDTDADLVARFGADGARLRRKIAELVPLGIWRRPPFNRIDYVPAAEYYGQFIEDLDEEERRRFFDALVGANTSLAVNITLPYEEADEALLDRISARVRDARMAAWQNMLKKDPFYFPPGLHDPLKKKDVRAIFDAAALTAIPSYAVDNVLKRQLDPYAAVYSKQIGESFKVYVFLHFGSMGCETVQLEFGMLEPHVIIQAAHLIGESKNRWTNNTLLDCQRAAAEVMETAAALLPIIEGKVAEYLAEKADQG